MNYEHMKPINYQPLRPINYEPIKPINYKANLIFTGTRPGSCETFGPSSSWQTVKGGWSRGLLGQSNKQLD